MDDWFNLNASIRRAVDPLALMQRVADQALATLAGADGVLVGLVVDDGSLRYVCGAGATAAHVGEALSLKDSLSGRALREGRTLMTEDTETDPRVDREATRAHHIRSMVSVPLLRGDAPLGVLNVSSSTPQAFEPRDVVLLAGLAEFMSAVVGAARDFSAVTARLASEARSAEDTHARDAEDVEDAELAVAGHFVANVLDPAGAHEAAVRGWIEGLVQSRDFSLVFQPIFELDRGSMLAAEALVRFSAWGSKRPEAVIAQAHRVGLGVDLEVAIVEAAVAHLGELPDDALLSLNAGPTALASGRIATALEAVEAEQVIVELTEQIKVDDYPHLAASLRAVRDTGARFAVDDAGAGFASLMHILKLAPDFIKLDGELINSIDIDPVRRSLAAALMRFAEETGAVLIAECIETPAELHALRELGVRYGQGFHLARPAPASELSQLLKRAAATLAA
jgi:EAL domain-containing protein (putative c-di-GMP-specific phosphodiesterase class I)